MYWQTPITLIKIENLNKPSSNKDFSIENKVMNNLKQEI